MFNFERFQTLMPPRKYLPFILLFLQSLLLNSQISESKSITLSWEDSKNVHLSTGQTLTLPLVKGNFFNENNLPTFSYSFNVENNAIVQDFQLKNVKFSGLSPEQAQDFHPGAIPEELNPTFKVTKIRNQSVAVLHLVPLVKENGRILKINSLTLEYTIDAKRSSGLKNSAGMMATDRSVLASGNWYQFRIDTTGIFKIDRNLLNQIGLNPSGIDPRNIRIYGNGGKLLPQLNSEFRYDDLKENAIYVSGQSDGSFDDDDFILFYGQGPDHWDINHDQIELSKHIKNIYSDYAYYFITVDLGAGKRMTRAPEIDRVADNIITSYQSLEFHELEKVNLFANGQQWLGEDFSFEATRQFNFPMPDRNIIQPVTVRARGVALSSSDTQMIITANGQDLMDLNYTLISSNSLTKASSDVNTRTIDTGNEDVNIQITYNNAGNPSSRAYLDYIEVFCTRNLVARGDQFKFRNTIANDLQKVYAYTIENAENAAEVWDISDPVNPAIMTNTAGNGAFTFKAFGGPKEYITLGTEAFFIPETIENSSVENQNLHGLKDIQYLIISPEFLKSEAERLAMYHREFSNLSVAVVDLEEIYNEFGSGSPDLTSIRDFIRFLYQNATSEQNRIKYVCLFGDASFDFKDRISDNTNIVPAFQSYESFNLATAYVTDDYFGMMDDAEGTLDNTDRQDVATGRFPVSTLNEARALVDKTLNYYQASSLGSWRNSVTFVADDPDNSGEFVLQQALDQITEELETTHPYYNINKIYADAYQQESSAGGERYPDVNEAIDNAIETGTLLLDYFGHGGVNGWAEERILEVPQIQEWNNFNTLPLLVTVTCEFARFDNPIRPTAGEYSLWNQKGGSAHLISTTREIFISVGEVFNRILINKLLAAGPQSYSISESLMRAKNESFTKQRFFVYSFGDPAMKLASPRTNIRLTKMNDQDLLQEKDTLKALSRIKLEGSVTDENDQLLSDFNGTLKATIFDKPLDKTTLDNDNLGQKMEFKAIESKIFSGRATISNGEFSFDFIVPKDIRIAYGKSKISLYARNNSDDRTGADQQIVIGGIDPDAPLDEQGPDIRLFMNDESFVDGGNTNSSPVLYAILEDSSGINTSITAVDHDIIAILDDNNNNPYVLNDYYETELNDFQKGKVKFTFRDLEPGLHTIKFKCWDTYNNPSESSLSFIVVNDNDLILSNVLNYPNPFVNYTEFWFNHNKPNETLDVQIQIFTVSGKLIKTLHRSVQSTGLLSREISWDGLDDFGNKIGKGVYVYKLHVRSQISNSRAEKFEKLVILQ